MFNPFRTMWLHLVVAPMKAKIARRVGLRRTLSSSAGCSVSWAGYVRPADGYELRWRDDEIEIDAPTFAVRALGDKDGLAVAWAPTKSGLAFDPVACRHMSSSIAIGGAGWYGPIAYPWSDLRGGRLVPDVAEPFVDFTIGGVRVRGVTAAERARVEAERQKAANDVSEAA
jgi:hypothetical protein